MRQITNDINELGRVNLISLVQKCLQSKKKGTDINTLHTKKKEDRHSILKYIHPNSSIKIL